MTFYAQIIIDNILTKTRHDEIFNITKQILKDKISKIGYLKKAGLLITSSHAKHRGFITDTKQYLTDIYEHQLPIHKTKDNTDTTSDQPWLFTRLTLTATMTHAC